MTLTRPSLPRCLALVLALAAVVPGCAGPRWQDATPIVAPADGTPAEARLFQVVDRARLAGYVVDEVDPAGGYLRVRAHLGDGGVVYYGVHSPGAPGAPTTAYAWGASTQSWLMVQVDGDGSLHYSAIGHAVREERGRIHRRLKEELERFAWLTSEPGCAGAGVAEAPSPESSGSPGPG